MKKTHIRIILTVLLLLAAFISSCSEEADKVSDTITDIETITVESAESETESLFPPTLPETDFDGREFRILVWSRDTLPLITDFCVDEESGDQLLDAVYRRNIAAEEQYNCKIHFDETSTAGILGTATKAILANENNWDIIDSSLYDINTLANKSYITELSTLEYLDLSAQWWDARFVDDMSINNKLYMILGDINILDDSCTWAFFYNKDIAASLNVNNLCEKVYDGTWTLDAVFDCAKTGAADLNRTVLALSLNAPTFISIFWAPERESPRREQAGFRNSRCTLSEARRRWRRSMRR